MLRNGPRPDSMGPDEDDTSGSDAAGAGGKPAKPLRGALARGRALAGLAQARLAGSGRGCAERPGRWHRGVREAAAAQAISEGFALAANPGLERALPPRARAFASVLRLDAWLARANIAAPRALSSGLMLAIRFVQARLLSVWGLVVAALLCPAEVFAQFAIYGTLASFLAIAALLRFEAVFFQNSDALRLGRAFRLALAAGGGVLALVALVLAAGVAAGWIAPAYGGLLLLSLAARAAIRLIVSEATAAGDFRTIGSCNVVQALVQPGVMLLLILPFGASSTALFAADAVGHLFTAGYLVRRRRVDLVALAAPAHWSLAELRASVRLWRFAPGVLLPSALLAFAFSVAPLLALPFAGSSELAAQVALAIRLLDVPTQMFGGVSGPVVMSHLRGWDGFVRMRRTRLVTALLFAGAAALYAGVAAAALLIDHLVVLGPQWGGIGAIIALLTPFYAGIALAMPLHEMGTVSQAPRRQTVVNLMALAAAAGVLLWFGTLSVPLLVALGAVSLLRTAAYAQAAWTRMGAVLQPA